MTYDIDWEKKGVLKNHIRKFLLLPERWTDPSNQISFDLTWKSYKFIAKNRSKIPREKGVYCFYVKPSYSNLLETKYLFYIGKTNRTLWERYKEYLNDQEGKGKPRAKVFEMLSLYKNNLYFGFAELKTCNQVNDSEEILINTFIPHINTSIPEAKISPEIKYIYE